MSAFIFSLLGLSVLGVLVDIVSSSKVVGVDFIFDIIILLVVIVNVVQMFKNWHLI